MSTTTDNWLRHGSNPQAHGHTRIDPADIEVDDILYLRSPDPFDGWYIPVHVYHVQPCTRGVYLHVKTCTVSGRTYSEPKWGDARYVSPADRVYHVGHAWEVPTIDPEGNTQ